VSDFIGQHDLVEALVEEFLDRQQRGEQPTIEEYEAQHPELAEELRELLEAVAVVRDLKPSSRDATGSLAGPASETPDGRRSGSATTASSARSAGAAWGSSTRPSRSRWAARWR
jgi:hypothetical protein